MSAYNREPHEKLQRLASIEVRLARHEKITRLGLIWLTLLAIAILGLLGYHIIRL